MFTIIYEKSSGKVVSITSISNEEELKKSLPESNSFIYVNEIPQYNIYRQSMVVKESVLTVVDLALTEEQEKFATNMEILQEIQALKEFLSTSDYKALKYLDGALSEVEYEPIRLQRDQTRAKINELEIKLR